MTGPCLACALPGLPHPSLSPGGSEGSRERRVGRSPHSRLHRSRLAAPPLLATWPHQVAWAGRGGWGGAPGLHTTPRGFPAPVHMSIHSPQVALFWACCFLLDPGKEPR